MNDCERQGEAAAELERQLADLWARFPAHSLPASMMMALETLEEALEAARAKAHGDGLCE